MAAGAARPERAAARILVVVAVAALGPCGPCQRAAAQDAQECPADAVDRLAQPPTLQLQCGAPCAPLRILPEDECRYDVSACENVLAGSICIIRCKAPYEGLPTFGRCPAENANPDSEPFWEPPECTVAAENLAEAECLEPDPIPAGYEKTELGEWQCAPGYTGSVVLSCAPGPSCVEQLMLSGCLMLVPCAVPRVDPCRIDVTECRDIPPGGMCQLHCLLPYEGPPSMAICEPGNADPEGELLLVPPECTLLCDDPIQAPTGYAQNGTGHWVCAEGYGGEAVARCAMDTGCASRKELLGCSPLQPCIVPETDACMYDFSRCADVQAGETCEVHCRSPYAGGIATARCPRGNTDPLRELVWTDPRCVLVCQEVDAARIGYIQYPFHMTERGWECVEGFSGVVSVSCATTPECHLEMSLSGCLSVVPCGPPLLTPQEYCMYDANPCLRVYSGYECEVACKSPYIGPTGTGRCPGNNTVAGRDLVWEPPTCILVCPEVDVIPPGYVADGNGGWLCEDGYVGTPVVECVIDLGCNAKYQFSGCDDLVACILPPDAVDNCWLNWTQCDTVYAGYSCDVTCAQPWTTLNSTIASCPASNTNASTPVLWTEPSCIKICDEPAARPGYVRPDVQCAPGYGGVARRECVLDDDCQPELRYLGCAPLVGCVLPVQSNPCLLDFSNCTGIGPGESCEVRCGANFEGGVTEAFCPHGNTDPHREIQWIPPRCELACPLPEPIPTGYSPPEKCGWQCATGYTGSASQECSLGGDSCSLQNELSGCAEMEPCTALVLEGMDACMYDASQCSATLLPGEFCQVSCRPPFFGTSSNVRCPMDNTDPTTQYVGLENLQCELGPLDCEVPDPMPEGYGGNFSYGFYCAEGYAGTPVGTCSINFNVTCDPVLELDGCVPVEACLIPDFDVCQWEIVCSGVNKQPGDSVPSGATCQVLCKTPYQGEYFGAPIYISCPANNRNPNIATWDAAEWAVDQTMVLWSRPLCSLACGTVTSQEGYRNLGTDVRGNFIWACESGYVGSAIFQSCIVQAGCVAVPTLNGCDKLESCAPLTLVSLDACRVDASECQSVDAGASCTLTCKLPLRGAPTRGSCMSGNTLAARQLYWSMPACVCVINPESAPPGYLMDSDTGEYYCGPGYLGEADVRCYFDHDCNLINEFEGCHEIVPCGGVVLPGDEVNASANATWCRLDLGNCTDLDAGETCTVKCAPPFTGEDRQAHCPADNIDPESMPVWEDDACSFECPPRDVPAGYLQGDDTVWQCEEGYRGTVDVACLQAGEGDCTPNMYLKGCEPLRRCALPQLTPEDMCRLDFSNCHNTQPGEYCEVHCKRPYMGNPAAAFCAPDNTDPRRVITWSEPLCELNCLDPFVFPTGYVKTPECGWQCAPSYAGTAVPHCTVDEQCIPTLRLAGCAPQEYCDVPRLTPTERCLVDADECLYSAGGSRLNSLPPGFSCTVRCRAPAFGTATVASCDIENTLRYGPMVWEKPNCMVNCSDPAPPPPGYVKNGNTWECAERYMGEVSPPYCALDSNCRNPHLVLEGCEPLFPCLEPEVENACMLNSTECAEVWPGEQHCTMACQAPYVGPGLTVGCADGNQERNRTVERHGEPQCVLTCEEPAEEPPGYERDGQGGWRCAANAVGVANVHCVINDRCQSRTVFEGCDLLRPCATPATACSLNATACARLHPGETCMATCRFPFLGDAVEGACPPDNIDTRSPPVWRPAAPFCACPNLTDVPMGYVRSNDTANGWACMENYTGTAAEHCGCDGQITLSGCISKRACAAPNPAYLADPGRCQRVNPGETCNVTCLRSGCVSGGSLAFHCPAENVDPAREPDLLEGRCAVTCEVCEASSFTDSNGVEGVMSGQLTFGPAHASDLLNVTDIEGYVVYFADSCLQPFGDPAFENLAVVPRGTQNYECCLFDAYAATFENVLVPIGATYLVIAVHSLGQVLPMGRAVDFADTVPLEGGRRGETPRVPQTTSSQRGASTFGLGSLVAAMAGWWSLRTL